MEHNGAIVCFQKYTIGNWNTNPSDDNEKKTISGNGPVCIGYFNRVDVKCIDHFRDYVKIASKHEAERACSRKQLLLRRMSDKVLHEQIEFLNSDEIAGDELPFCSTESDQKYVLGCCSVFSVKVGDCKKRSVTEGKCKTFSTLAQQLYEQIKGMQEKLDFRFAIMELLGTEDLCLIVLSNHFRYISDVLYKVQSFRCGSGESNVEPCGKCHIDNVHSILLMDRENLNLVEDAGWEQTQAEIHFSLRTFAGMHYLRDIESKLHNADTLHEGETVLLESCSGEYDAILRCPARLLLTELFCRKGYFHPEEPEYQKSVYQSETFLYPFGNGSSNEPPENPPDEETESFDLDKIAESAINALRKQFAFDEGDIDFDYLELPIWRLLKDYRSFASFPLDENLRQDLQIQLVASINAIVKEAELCAGERDGDRFLKTYDRIVDALGASMQAGSQQDRWNFGEQQSYIQNVDSYYKILRCYYGMIKDMITLIYHIERENVNDQPLLIPLLSFGIMPIIKSDCYNSFIGDRAARLICIRMPYQALANPPKYLGVLAHEIFHYAAPSARAKRNELMLKNLLRVALTEFISMLARTREYADKEDYWKQFFDSDEEDRQFFNCLVEKAFQNIEEKLQSTELETERYKDLSIAKLKLIDMETIVLPRLLYFTNKPLEENAYNFYFQVWQNMRNVMRWNLPMVSSVDLRIFGLDPDHENLSDETVYSEMMSLVGEDFVKGFRDLLYSTFKAMEECPADIFDLETVLAGKDNEQKIGQFLWQIHGTKRDFMTMRRKNNRMRDNRMKFDGNAAKLLKNDIRVGMTINCYLDQEEKESPSEQLDRILENWAPEDGMYHDVFDEVKQEFIEDFQYVNARFVRLLGENTAICTDIIKRIRNLKACDTCGKIMDRLTEYYVKYCKILDRRQRCTDEDVEEIYYRNHFELCCELIDEYQSQAPFEIESATSAPLNGNSTVDPELFHLEKKSCSWFASTSADLSYAVGKACDRMKIHGKIPVLWFRGQLQEDWKTLPNIMRLKKMNSENPNPEGFSELLRDEIRWAKAHILPQGMEFSDAEWLAYLQHYEFKTSVLDFSESLYPALYFATEKWQNKYECLPKKNAVLMVLNPILFNLAMESLEAKAKGDGTLEKALGKLKDYLANGTQFDQPPLFADGQKDTKYQYLYDMASTDDGSKEDTLHYPRAVFVPRHCDRMDKQSGEFIYYALGTCRSKDKNEKGNYTYEHWSLEELHKSYRDLYYANRDKLGGGDFIPFLYRIKINRFRYVDFKNHLLAIGMRKFSVYPEHDKLAYDLQQQLEMN